MAYRRSVTARAKLFYQQRQNVAPSFSHINRDDIDHDEFRTPPVSTSPNYIQQRFFGNGNSFSSFHGSRNLFQDRRFAIPTSCGQVFTRNFSGGAFGEGANKTEILTDVLGDKTEILTDVIGDKVAELAPVVSEVSVAAADSFFPVAALQYLIDYVHVYTGLDWWASIVVTTILIRWIQLPVMINQLKATSKFTLLKPKLEAVKEEMDNRDMSPEAVAEGRARMKELFKEYGVTPFTPLKGLLITAPIFCSFFFAIRNMAEKVPSFQDGGAFWFTDLTTPDAMYIFPVLTALSFWITVECNAQEGLEGNPTAGTIKNVSRVFAALTIPLTAAFPKAVFCYWITSNLFSLTYGLVIRRPAVKEFLGVPLMPKAPPASTTNGKPKYSFIESMKKYAEAQQDQSRLPPSKHQSLSPPPEESPKPGNQRIAASSVLSQRIRSLEKEVKGRKKGKKR